MSHQIEQHSVKEIDKSRIINSISSKSVENLSKPISNFSRLPSPRNISPIPKPSVKKNNLIKMSIKESNSDVKKV